MITNDEQFKETFKEYVKGYGIETNEIHMCNGLPCRDCILKPISDETYDTSKKTCNVCEERPFQKIKEYEKKIALLKQQISIMQTWKRSREINNKLKDFCKAFRSGTSLSDLTCCGIDCDKCLFHDMDNFREWARKVKEESLGEENDGIS